jgi:hypothetical protein
VGKNYWLEKQLFAGSLFQTGHICQDPPNKLASLNERLTPGACREASGGYVASACKIIRLIFVTFTTSLLRLSDFG